MRQLSKEQAVSLSKKNLQEKLTKKEIFFLQINQPRLLFENFGIFHEAVEEVLGRPVYTHEFVNPDKLLLEYLNNI